jgi:hypothetical protein
MLTLTLDCPFLIVHSVFSSVYLSCVLRTQCCQCLWIVHSWWSPRFSLMFIYPVSCVLNTDSTSGLSILDCPSVFSNLYLSCVLCTQCWQCLCIIHSWLSPRFSLTFLSHVSCVLNVDSASGLSILDWPFGFLYRLFLLCPVYSMLTVPLDCPFLMAPSIFSNVYLACVSCAQSWQWLWIFHSWLSSRFSLAFICPVSCVLTAASVSGLSILDGPLGFL